MTEQRILHDDDKDIDVQVTGNIIGTASSQYPDALRWTSVDIWETAKGQFVVHKIGHTRVFHAISGCNEKAPLGPADEYMIPCTVCNPLLTSGGTYRVETTRSSVHICATPEGVMESLISVDKEGVTYINKTASIALRRAALKQPALRVPVIVD